MKQNLVIITSFGFVMSIFGLLGCDNGRDVTSICKNNPEICTDLNQDSWCFSEKNQLILQRFEVKEAASPTDKQLYKLLLGLEDYGRCIELASGVQHIVHTERTADRARAYGLSTEGLKQLQEETRQRPEPYLSYYQWTRYSDTNALNRLLTLEKTGKLTEPYLLGQIATYYSNRNPIKSQQLYLKVLNQVQYQDFDANWLLGMASAYRQTQALDKTYMLTKANLLLTQQKYSEEKLLSLIAGDQTLATQLDEQAKALVMALTNNQYPQSQVRDWLEPKVEAKPPKTDITSESK